MTLEPPPVGGVGPPHADASRARSAGTSTKPSFAALLKVRTLDPLDTSTPRRSCVAPRSQERGMEGAAAFGPNGSLEEELMYAPSRPGRHGTPGNAAPKPN